MSCNDGSHYFNPINLIMNIAPARDRSMSHSLLRLAEHNRKVAANRQGIARVERLMERKSAALARVEGV
jgi:hypothetical protein